jgi:hypothetical protein
VEKSFRCAATVNDAPSLGAAIDEDLGLRKRVMKEKDRHHWSSRNDLPEGRQMANASIGDLQLRDVASHPQPLRVLGVRQSRKTNRTRRDASHSEW